VSNIFNENAQLDASQVNDRRGSRRGTAVAAGGGGIGLIVFLAAMLLGVNPSQIPGGSQTMDDLLNGLDGQTARDSSTQPSTVAQNCKTGADANAREDCRIVGFVNSVQAYWSTEMRQRGVRYAEADTTFFTSATNTGCGNATTEVGPFYCPEDHIVYIDLGFYRELQTRFGAKGGPFAQAYVIAHEYGHHIQSMTGVLDRIGNDRQGPQSRAVRAELQADCYAGMWAHNAATTGYLRALDEQEIQDALDAAQAVGDDRIQKEFQGRVTPETWTHGSSAQRQRWFTTGYQNGQLESCDTTQGAI